MIGFTLGPYHMAAADRAALRHLERLPPARMIFVVENPCDLWNHIAAAFNFNPIADLRAEPFDLVHVVQRGAADGGAADRDRLQLRDRGEFPSTPDLHVNIFDLRNTGPRCVFVSNRPARSLAGEAELPVQSRAVDFDHDSINFVG